MEHALGLLLLLLSTQSRMDRLAEWHPDLFERAVAIEQKVLRDAGIDGDADFGSRAMRGRQYTWSGGETLPELRSRRAEILERHEAALSRVSKAKANVPLIEGLPTLSTKTMTPYPVLCVRYEWSGGGSARRTKPDCSSPS